MVGKCNFTRFCTLNAGYEILSALLKHKRLFKLSSVPVESVQIFICKSNHGG
jgi:hypothetical protein